jgi:hypothetical protein
MDAIKVKNIEKTATFINKCPKLSTKQGISRAITCIVA